MEKGKGKMWLIIGIVIVILLIIGFIYWKNKPLLDKSTKSTPSKGAATNPPAPVSSGASNNAGGNAANANG